MELGRTLSFIFEDKNWLEKVLPLLVLGILSAIPVIGFVPFALVIGYMMQLARNVRDGLPRPLPKWDAWQAKLSVGGQIVLAMVVYNVPLIVMGVGSWYVIGGIISGILGGLVNLFLFCCTMPMLFLYALVAYPLLAIGITEYLTLGDYRRMYRLGHLWDVLSTHYALVYGWVMNSIILNIILGFVGAIPLIGTIPVLLFGVPMQGHLFGQFAHKLGIVNQPRPSKRR